MQDGDLVKIELLVEHSGNRKSKMEARLKTKEIIEKVCDVYLDALHDCHDSEAALLLAVDTFESLAGQRNRSASTNKQSAQCIKCGYPLNAKGQCLNGACDLCGV